MHKNKCWCNCLYKANEKAKSLLLKSKISNLNPCPVLFWLGIVFTCKMLFYQNVVIYNVLFVISKLIFSWNVECVVWCLFDNENRIKVQKSGWVLSWVLIMNVNIRRYDQIAQIYFQVFMSNNKSIIYISSTKNFNFIIL